MNIVAINDEKMVSVKVSGHDASRPYEWHDCEHNWQERPEDDGLLHCQSVETEVVVEDSLVCQSRWFCVASS